MKRNDIRSGLSRKERHERFAIKDWVNRLSGVPAFIVGCSPSTDEIDFSLLKNYFTIGINRAFKLIDPTILMWQDITFWNTESSKIKNLKAIKIARDIADPKRLYYNFYLKSSEEYKFDDKTYILNGRGSSGPIAVELAVALGCSPIVLLGLDCQTDGERTDFFGKNPYWTEFTVGNCIKGLEFIKNNCPVQVINCGRSNLWECHALPEAVKIVDPNKIYNKGREAYVNQLLNKPK